MNNENSFRTQIQDDPRVANEHLDKGAVFRVAINILFQLLIPDAVTKFCICAIS